MKILKTFLISLLLTTCALDAAACINENPERWYMFCTNHHSISFRERYDNSVDSFWMKYARLKNNWYTHDDLIKAARSKNDREMTLYLSTLGRYQDIVADMTGDRWEYPSAQELSDRKATLRQIVKTCDTQQARASRVNDMKARWLLLEMRANMVLRTYKANTILWTSAASRLPQSIYREMMRNIYANALLHTGDKLGAWNIYADQGDDESLIWSVHKYTNLAGIKAINDEHPDAPVLSYLLQCYVNNIQEVYDGIEDSGDRTDTPLESFYEVYARLDSDWKKEIADFIDYATAVGTAPSTHDPCLWLTAAALASHYSGSHSRARQAIDMAMGQNKGSASNDLARRCRMLIYCATEDISSQAFKSFMAGELTWLDGFIATHPDMTCAANARDRILNLGLSRRYEEAGDTLLAIAINALRATIDTPQYYVNRPDDDHSSDAFTTLFAMPSSAIKSYFDFIRDPGDDPLASYVVRSVNYSDDYINDIIGTRLIAEEEFNRALPYLTKVSQNYLDRQAIAPYVAKRDYHKSFWDGWQTVGDIPWEPTEVKLNGNVKVRFAQEMSALKSHYNLSTGNDRAARGLTLARYYYQASPIGQCWFLTNYGTGSYAYEKADGYSWATHAVSLLNDALATASDSDLKAQALYALAFSAPDEWVTYEWDSDYENRLTILHPESAQYTCYKRLNNLLTSNPAAASASMSRCDVLKQFRRMAI